MVINVFGRAPKSSQDEPIAITNAAGRPSGGPWGPLGEPCTQASESLDVNVHMQRVRHTFGLN